MTRAITNALKTSSAHFKPIRANAKAKPQPTAKALKEHYELRKDDRLITGPVTRQILGVHKPTIQRRMKSDPLFPKPVRVKVNQLKFWESDVYSYLALVTDT